MAHLRGLVLLFLEGRPQASPDRARAEARVGSCGAMDLPWVLDPWAPSCLVLFKGFVCRTPALGRPSSWLSLGPMVGRLTVAAALSAALGPSAAWNWGWGSGLPSCTPWNSELPPVCPRPECQHLGSPLHSSTAGPGAQSPPRPSPTRALMSSLRCGFLCPGCRPALPCLRPLATLWFPPGGSCFRRMKSPVTALLRAVQFCSVAACPSQPQAF